MRYLAENLKKDLGLTDKQLEVMHGGMSDKELQRIVDEFGRAESPIRVIVASDVASEGINLHYLSHRLERADESIAVDAPMTPPALAITCPATSKTASAKSNVCVMSSTATNVLNIHLKINQVSKLARLL